MDRLAAAPTIARYLETIVELHATLAGQRPGADRMICREELLFRWGNVYPGRSVKPRSMGVPRQCFNNAWHRARKSLRRLAYCEGLAFPANGVMPVYHAWVVTPEGVAEEITWATPDASANEYVGICFNLDYVRRSRKGSSIAAVIDNHARGWPLLTGAEDIQTVMLPPQVIQP